MFNVIFLTFLTLILIFVLGSVGKVILAFIVGIYRTISRKLNPDTAAQEYDEEQAQKNLEGRIRKIAFIIFVAVCIYMTLSTLNLIIRTCS